MSRELLRRKINTQLKGSSSFTATNMFSDDKLRLIFLDLLNLISSSGEPVTITSDYTITDENKGNVLLVDTTSGIVNIDLPIPSSLSESFLDIHIIHIAGENNINVRVDNSIDFNNYCFADGAEGLAYGTMFLPYPTSGSNKYFVLNSQNKGYSLSTTNTSTAWNITDKVNPNEGIPFTNVGIDVTLTSDFANRVILVDLGNVPTQDLEITFPDLDSGTGVAIFNTTVILVNAGGSTHNLVLKFPDTAILDDSFTPTEGVVTTGGYHTVSIPYTTLNRGYTFVGMGKNALPSGVSWGITDRFGYAIGGADNLGNHIATQNLDLGGFAITNLTTVDGRDVSADGSTLDALAVDSHTHANKATLDLIDQDVSIGAAPVLDATNMTNLPAADNLGNHTATTDLDLAGNDIINVGNITPLVGTSVALTGGALVALVLDNPLGVYYGTHAAPATSGAISISSSVGASYFAEILYQNASVPTITGITDQDVTTNWDATNINVIVVYEHGDGTYIAKHAGTR